MQRDEALALSAGQGDRDAFTTLVERHKSRVYYTLLRMVGNEQDAADLAQDVFVKLYRTLGQYRSESAFTTWLHRLAVNTGLDWLRSRQRKPLHVPLEEPEHPGDDLEETAIRQEQRERLLAAVRSLPPDYRTAVLMRHFHQLSYEEIAQRTGAPVRTVETRLYRARALLREALSEGSERHDMPARAAAARPVP